MISLYGVNGPNVAKARGSLIYKQLTFEEIGVQLIDKSAAFRDLSPIGKVPVLRDDDIVVTDSLYIAEYLDRQYPSERRLLPDQIEKRMQVYSTIGLLDRIFELLSPVVAIRMDFFDMVGIERAALSGYHQIEDSLAEYLLTESANLFELLHDRVQVPVTSPEDLNQAHIASYSLAKFYASLDIPIGSLATWCDSMQNTEPFATMLEVIEVPLQEI